MSRRRPLTVGEVAALGAVAALAAGLWVIVLAYAVALWLGIA